MALNANNADLSSLRITRDQPAGHPPTRSRRNHLLYFSIASVVVLVVVFLLLMDVVSSPEQVEAGVVMRASSAQASAVLTASGYVVADRKAAVASKGTGRLEYLGVEEGDHVKKGEIIGRLESSDVEAALQQSKANLAVARASLEQARAEFDDATANYERQKNLLKQKLVSQAEFDASNARYKRANAGVASGEAAVKSAEAGVRAAEVQVENTFIRSPFDGVVLTKTANVGEVITPFGAAAGSRGALVTLADMSSLEVEADVSESNIERVHMGQPCEITLDAYPEKRYGAYVHKIVPTADRAKATVMTKIRFESRDERVLPEMSAKVSFLNQAVGKSGEDSVLRILVPSAALTVRNGKKIVFVIKKEKIVEAPVTVGRPIGDGLEVREGLSVGDKVVLHPSEKLSAGMKVKVRE